MWLTGTKRSFLEFHRVKLDTMFPVLGESDEDELPVFLASTEQLPDTKGTIQPPLSEDKVVVLCSSDSEGSSTASPAWKKSCGVQDSAKVLNCVKAVSLLSSESEEDEGEELISLAERLKMKILPASSSTAGPSFTRILEPQDRGLAAGSQLLSNEEKTAADYRQQTQQPRRCDPQRRPAPNTWELSGSDDEPALSDPKKQPWLQPVVCDSDRLMENLCHQVTEMSSKPFSLQTKPKRSQEELNKAREAALQRRKEREAQKVLKDQERERKKALASLRRAQRPEECLKHIQVVLDPGLLQAEGGGQLLAALQAMDCSCVIESQAVPCSMTWRRKLGQGEDHSWEEEPNLLVLMLPDEFVALIHNSKQVTEEGTSETLQSFVANILKKTPGKTLALAAIELEKYFSKHKSQKKLHQAVQTGSRPREQDKARNWGGKSHSILHLSRVDMEEALVGLQIHTGVQVRILESWKEFSDFASMFTKAVAEAPFKRERDRTSFSFCLEGDWTGGVKVDRFGKGLLQVWKRQIQQFNRVSQEMASAIVARYPSPLLLKQAYDALSSEQERHNLLAEIPVRRGDGVTATTRRIGPELSKRIYLHMTSHNADLSLDITG